MTDRISKLQRWLDLLAYLGGRRFPVTADDLMVAIPAYARRIEEGDSRAHATVRRMFERDKEELRELGIPIETVPASAEAGGGGAKGYRLPDRDLYLPVLKVIAGREGAEGAPSRPPGAVELREEEARLALDALRKVSRVPGHPFARDGRTALAKLTFDLDPAAFPAADTVVLPPYGARADPDVLRELREAVTARRRLRFVYRSIGRDEVTDREVEPRGLLFRHGRWYLVAHDATRDGERLFRISRIGAIGSGESTGGPPDFDAPEDFDPAAYLGREAWELGDEDDEPLTARVRFRFPASVSVDRRAAGELVRRTSDGSTVREFTVRNPNAFVRWILPFGGGAEILEPESLRRELRTVARGVVRSHRAPTPPPATTDRRTRPTRTPEDR